MEQEQKQEQKTYPHEKVMELLKVYGDLRAQASLMYNLTHPMDSVHFGRKVLNEIADFKKIASPELLEELDINELEEKALHYSSIFKK